MNCVLAAPVHRKKPLATAVFCTALMTLAASCGEVRHSPNDGSLDGGGPGMIPPPTFFVGGHIMGLAGSGLVLQNNAADDLTITANGTFVFPAELVPGGAFDITVKTQPMAPKQACAVSGGKGVVANGNVTSVTVNCTTDRFTIGGTVSGLAGIGLVLRDNAGDPISVNANGTFAFPQALADGSSYEVTVPMQPANPRQTCSVISGSGKLASANVTSVLVECVTDRFRVGGTVLGLAGTGLTLQDNGGDDLPIHADGNFAFATALADLAPFEVTIKTQPSGPAQTCIVSGGSGTLAGSSATSIVVNCSTNTYTVGGTVSGLVGSGLVLLNNGTDRLPVGSTGTFAFATPLADQSPYDVRVAAQPSNPSQTCTVANGSGNVAQGAVSNIAVTCTTNTYAVGGTLSGLASGETIVLRNGGGDDLTLSANGLFTFPTPVASGTTYMATVRTNPSTPINQTCTATHGSGTVTDAAVTTITVACVTNRYTVGGTVSGLAGTGLVLRNSVGDDLPVTADGTFTFATSLESGTGYDVSILTQPSRPAQTCVVAGGTGTVASGNVVSIVVNCATDSFTIAGTVSGLDGIGLVLQNNGGDDLAINANGSFAFATPLADLSAYAVTVRTQPTSRSQTCTVSNGSGNLAGGNVANVAITCVTNRYTVGGTVSGLAGTGLVLRNNASDALTIHANGTFTFPTSLASGASYAVTVQAPPSGPRQTCTVTNGAGAVTGGDVTNVAVSCTTNTYTIGGTVSGLAGTGLVLRNNAGDDLPIGANGTFTFATALADLSAYAVTVRTQPATPSQTCAVSSGSGTLAGANVTSVAVTCVTNRYVVGGTVSGLAGTGLVLRNNAGDDLPIGGNGAFSFATSLPSGTSYNVTIQIQPNAPRQTCVVMGGSGTVVNGNVTSVSINCTTDRFIIGGTVSGLGGTGLVLRNGADNLAISANGTFAFATSLPDFSPYAVTVQTQPNGPSQTCTVANGSGNVSGANVTNVAVSCATNTFTIGGTVSGLGSGQSVVLQNNGGNNLTVSASGGFTFTAPVASGSTYNVTVLANPATSTCTVTSGSGTVAATNVTNVVVNCVVNTYSVGGSVSGLTTGQSVVLQNNGGNSITVSANGQFVFSTQIASGSTYNVTVATTPPGRTCTVSNGAGTVTTSAITNVAVTCTPNTYTIGGTVSGLGTGQSAVLQNNGTNNLTVVNGIFTFTASIASGATYAVTVFTKPTDHNCTIANGSGTVVASNITNVAVSCVPICIPSCGGRNCGDDGCGNSCGSCGSGQTCSSSGVCVCEPSCAGKACGDDGCGGSCGSCSGRQTCSSGVCTPSDCSCAGKNCGDDGCGGSCGFCGPGQTCSSSGVCVCVPNCTGKTCGDDGCGGFCGSCAPDQTCSSNGTCVCAPSCAGKTCGDDGCGGSCGSCGPGLACSSGVCVCQVTKFCRVHEFCCEFDGCGNCTLCQSDGADCP